MTRRPSQAAPPPDAADDAANATDAAETARDETQRLLVHSPGNSADAEPAEVLELQGHRNSALEEEVEEEGVEMEDLQSQTEEPQSAKKKLTKILTLNLRGERIYMPESELFTFYRPLYYKLIGGGPSPPLQCVRCPGGEKYYDADPMVFRLLMSYYRYGSMHLPSYICGPLLEKEVEFWGVTITPECLEACCMHSALESKRWKVLLDNFEHKALTPPADDSLVAVPDKSEFRRLWHMVSNPCSSALSAAYALVMITCSLASAIIYTKDPPSPCSDWGYRGQHPANCTIGTSRTDMYYVGFQCGFTALFTVDLIIRALLAPNRAKFVRSPHTWNDVLSLVPLYGFLLYRMTGARLDLDSPTGWVFELLSVALFFRVFRILRHFIGIRVMAYTLMTGLSDLLVVMLLVFTATFLFGTVFFLIERSHPDNREKVPTMFHGYYWAVITITTVGYGDVTPSTLEGRILAILCSLVGLIVVAFTVPILTENFKRYYGHTCHLSMRGELGNFVLKARKCVRRVKRRIYYASC